MVRRRAAEVEAAGGGEFSGGDYVSGQVEAAGGEAAMEGVRGWVWPGLAHSQYHATIRNPSPGSTRNPFAGSCTWIGAFIPCEDRLSTSQVMPTS
jgi:hypothetical protein